MSDEDAFDHRLVKPAQAYAKLYPSIGARLKAAYDAGNPLVRVSTRCNAAELRLRSDARQ